MIPVILVILVILVIPVNVNVIPVNFKTYFIVRKTGSGEERN